VLACAARNFCRLCIYDFTCVKIIRFYSHFLTPSVASGSMPRTGCVACPRIPTACRKLYRYGTRIVVDENSDTAEPWTEPRMKSGRILFQTRRAFPRFPFVAGPLPDRFREVP
jgi:hypothetical protein